MRPRSSSPARRTASISMSRSTRNWVKPWRRWSAGSPAVSESALDTLMISPLDPSWFQRAADYQARLTMPPGALGRLLELGQQLCAVQERLRPVTEPAAVLVMAADHGIAAEGVSAFPQ